VARYLTTEWVESFDAALAALDLHDAIAAAGEGSLAAADGTFSVVQVVSDVPGATEAVHLVLRVADDKVSMSLDPERAHHGTATILLGYADAFAMALGELDPADALADGRVRVRGDLAALVAGQEILAAASDRLGPSLAELTDADDLDADPA
jgi:hypothetical protein